MAEESAFAYQSLILKKRTKQIPLPLCGLGMTGQARSADFVLFEVCGFSNGFGESPKPLRPRLRLLLTVLSS